MVHIISSTQKLLNFSKTVMGQNNTQQAAKEAVVLLNFGGPRTADEVEPFLYEILRDPNTLQLPFPQWAQDLLARRIARKRAPELIHQYQQIGGASPIVPATERLAQALGQVLGQTLPILPIHRYLPGWAAQVARQVVGLGVQRLLAVPLYPHFSFATTGSSLAQFQAALQQAGFAGELRVMASYPEAPGLVAAMGDRLRQTLEQAALTPSDTVILCSAHGLPEVYVQRGDPYRLELYRTLEALQQAFPQWRLELCFQSRVGPMEWLRPYTDDKVRELGSRSGVRQVVFVPLAFVNDHVETLYEIGHTYFDLARQQGLTPHRVPAVEDHPGLVETLAQAVRRWQAGRGGVPVAELLPPSQWRRRHWPWLALLLLLLGGLVAEVVLKNIINSTIN